MAANPVTAIVLAADGCVEVRCHLCGKWKWSTDSWRALYELAFHYDRRHKGWTHEVPREKAS